MIFHYVLRHFGPVNALLAASAFAAWASGITLLILHRGRYPSLDRVDLSQPEMADLPRLSILVPACDEAATIERAMRSLIDLEYPDYEIIAVNDRSTDGTGPILEAMAHDCPRLKVIHVESLPAGWLGKNHALHIASQQATGDWLLFTDADVIHNADTLSRAVAWARKRSLGHLVLCPRVETHGFWEKLFVSYFGLMFSFRVRPWAVADANKSAYIGVGAFNLVRADAYRSFGGHTALAMEVCDDTKLGKLIKQHGFQQHVLNGPGLLSVRWVVGLRGAIDGLSKNAFAGFEFRPAEMLASVGCLAVSGVYPVIALATHNNAVRLLGLASLLLMVVGGACMRRIADARLWIGAAYPVAALLLIFIILRSTYRVYQCGGIVWRGTHYALDELRRGVV